MIGNPPYGAVLTKSDISYFSEHYPNTPSTSDTYMLFVEKCLELSRSNAKFAMIIPNTWTLLFNAQKFRRYLFENYTIEQIVHFNHRVFPKVTVDCEILVACNAPPQGNEVEITLQNLDDSIRYSVLQEDWIKKNGDIISIRQTSEASKIVNKLEILSVRMEDICEIKNGIKPFEVGKGTPPQTKAIASSKPFVSDTKDDNSFVPLLRGSLINRYRTLWNRNYWVSYGPWLAAPRDPHIFFTVPRKIVVRQTGDSLIATIIDNTYVCRNNMHMVFLKQEQGYSLDYLLGILNSRLMNWYYQIINPEQGEALAEIKAAHLYRFPIRLNDPTNPTDVAQHDRLVALVQQMLDLHRRAATEANPQLKTVVQRQIDATDKQIDRLVYGLYGLTEEEVGIVEGAG